MINSLIMIVQEEKTLTEDLNRIRSSVDEISFEGRVDEFEEELLHPSQTLFLKNLDEE